MAVRGVALCRSGGGGGGVGWVGGTKNGTPVLSPPLFTSTEEGRQRLLVSRASWSLKLIDDGNDNWGKGVHTFYEILEFGILLLND